MTADPFAIVNDASTPQPKPVTPGPQLDTPPAADKAPGAPAGDVRPKRPTTRAERAAVSAANAKKKAAKAADKMPAGKSVPRRASLESRLSASLASMGTMVTVAGAATNPAVYADGLVIVQHSGNIAAALDKVAKDDPRVAAALERMLTAGVWSGLVAALLPVALGIAANHGAIPPHIAAMLAGPEGEAAPVG